MGMISGTGAVTLRPKATILRFHLVLRKEGDDMQSTLKTLDQTGDNFRKALLKAQAGKDSIKIDGPRLLGSLHALGELIPERGPVYRGKGKGKGEWPVQLPPNANQQVQQLPTANPSIQQNPTPTPLQQSQPPRPPENEIRRAPRIALEAQLRAEWPLHGKTTPELLVEADRIVLKVFEETKDLLPKQKRPVPSPVYSKGKGKGEEPFDPDESDEDSEYVTEPEYVFVATISEEELEMVRVEAFKKATAHAAAVAKVAGLRIGSLYNFSVSSTGFRGGDPDDPFAAPSTPLIPSPMAPPGGMVPVRDLPDSLEVVGSEPLSLQHAVSVNVTYRLAKPDRASK